MIRLLGLLLVVAVVLGLLGLGGAALATQYLFQEPAYVTWSRYFLPEFAWQRQKYPSLRWAFNIVEPLIDHSDPRETFQPTDIAQTTEELLAWSNPIVGPREPFLDTPVPAFARTIVVASAAELKRAVSNAAPGTVIEIEPGQYDVSGRSIEVTKPGTREQPVVLRGRQLGDVTLRFNLLEEFHVLAPHWTFENLIIEGICKDDGYCEHAFHVVGNGRGVVIRNNRILDFNAPVKVNGSRGAYPDNGLIEFNIFVNSRPRVTGNPVTLLDIVAVNNWRVRKNVIADFVKAGSDHVSYGAFFKGNGEGNIFEQNLVRCEWRHAGGTRIGFSFGGGGTSTSACRDGDCSLEHRNGTARNNVIMNCPNDVAIYLNKSAGTRIHNNALINSRGIDVRFEQSDAVILNNVIDGRILARDGGTYHAADNIVSPLGSAFLRRISSSVYAGPTTGDLRLLDLNSLFRKGSVIEDPGQDLCGQTYDSTGFDIGPIQYQLDLSCSPILR